MLAVPHEVRLPITVNTTIDSQKSVKWQDKKDKSGVLALGDILSLMVKDFYEEKVEVKVVTGDGIANVEMECAPKSFFDTNGEQGRFRQCLFKVETASQYGFQTRSKQFKDLTPSTPSDPVLSKMLESLAKDEAEANSTEAWEVLGKAIAYGDRIQLRHLQSDSYVTISEEIAREPGCLKVVLDKGGNEGSWLLVLPCNKLQKEGEVVRYSDPFFLRVSLDKSDYYLHLAKKVGRGPETIRELNGSIIPSQWQARKFISHAELKKNPEFVSTGDSFRIILKQNEGYLTVTSPDVGSILPEKLIISDRVDLKKQEVKEQKTEPILYIDDEKTSLNVWELERKRVSVGGIALEHELFRVKNVSTGYFLALESEKNVVMTKDGNKDTVLFRFIPEDSTGGQLKFKSLLRFQHYRTKKYIQAKEEMIELQGLFGEVEEKMPISFTVASDSSEPLSQIFIFEDEAEDNTVHIHQVSLVLPKIVSYYEFLQKWGLMERKGVYYPDFDRARNTESDLEANSKHLTQILANVTRRVLKEDEPGLRLRQQSFLESNLLLVFIKLAELIHEKSKTYSPSFKKPDQFPSKKVESEENTPQILARGHLIPLARQLYMTLFSAIKNNPDSCQVVYNNAQFLSTQLSDYKVEVGKLLKETFRHTVGVEHSTRREELSTWLYQIAPLNEAEDNILGQTVILKIMCSLCLANNQAIPKFQNIIDEGLAGRDRKMCKFRMYSGEPCFELDTGGGSLEGFLEANPVLKIIGKKVEDDHVLVAVYFLNTVSPHKNLVNYLVAVLNVLIHISYDRNSKAATQVIKDYNLSFDFAFICMKDPRIHLKLRERFSNLCRVVFLDRDPLMHLMDRLHTCFMWEQKENKINDRENDSDNFDLFPFLRQSEAVVIRVTELVQWVEHVWITPDYPYKPGLTVDKVHFVTEMIRLTKLLIDLGYTGYEFFSNVHESILRLIPTEPGEDRHWCDHLCQEMRESRENISEAVIELQESAVEVLALGAKLRESRQVEAFCNCFGRLKESEVDEQRKVLAVEVFRANEYYTRVRRDKENDTEKVKKQRSIKKVSPDDILPPPARIDYDQILLRLFLQCSSSRLPPTIFPILLSDFYQRHTLKSLLASTVILETLETQMMLRKMKAIHGRLFVLIREIKFASDVSTESFEKATVEMSELLITLSLIGIELKKLLNLQQPLSDLKLAQNTASNLGITRLLFTFVEEDYPWVVRNPVGALVLSGWTLPAYKEILSCLFLNCFCNSEIQQFAFDRITAVARFTANSIGCFKLMREAMASQRTSTMASKMIEYIIGLLSSHPEPRDCPGNLAILTRLIVDDDGKLHKSNQEMIFKAVTQNKALMKLYDDDGSINLTQFKQDTDVFIRFHAGIIRLFGLCALDNRIVTMHCQRLLPFYFLFREICKENVHFYVKREYLMFVFRVYAVELTDGMKRGLPLNDFFELLNSVIIPDLEQFPKHRENLLAIGRKNMFPSIYCSQASEFEFNNRRVILEKKKKGLAKRFTTKPQKQQPQAQNEEFDTGSLSKDQQDSLQYWKYITNLRPWSPYLCSGVLQFIEDFSQELNIHNHPCSPDLFASLDRMKQVLGEVLDSIMVLRKDHSDLDFAPLVNQLNDCIQEIPNYILDEAVQETEAMELKAYQELLTQIKAYLERTHLSLGEFFANLHPEQTISKKQLLLKLKDILETQISSHQLILALNYMDPQLQQQYDLKAFHSDMKKYLHRATYIVRKLKREPEEDEKNEEISSHVYSELQLFLKTRYELISDSQEESREMAAALREAIANAEGVSGAGAFRLVLQQSDDAVGPQILFLKAMIEVVTMEGGDAITVKKIREWLLMAETIELTLDLSHTCNDSDLSEQCLTYINALLSTEMDTVLPRLMQKLSEISFIFFLFFVNELRAVKSWIQQQTKEKAILAGLTYIPAFESATVDQSSGQKSYLVAKQLLLLVQHCCKTCDRSYQSLFREQISNSGSINLVSEIANFLVFLRSIPDLKDKSNETEAAVMSVFILNTLLDLISGVCIENQKEIGSKRALYQFVNWIIEDHYMYTEEEDKRLPVAILSIRFLKDLVEGAKDAYIIDIIIEEVNTSDLVRMSESIYSQLVASRVRKVLQDSAGHGKVGWECLELSGEEVTPMQREIIDMAFDIRILMKKLNSLTSIEVTVESKSETTKEDDLSTMKLKRFNDKFYTHFKTTEFKESVPTDLLTLTPLQKMKEAVTRTSWKEQEQTQQMFFEAFISTIDINYRGEIVRVFFRIPPVCSHAPRFMRRHLVKKMAMLGHQEKLRKFVNLSDTYELEMKHRQELARYPIFMSIFKRWRGYYRVSFLLVVIINVMLLFSREHEDGSTGESSDGSNVQYVTYILGAAQVIAILLAFVSYPMLYYPVIINRRLQFAEIRLRKKLTEPMSRSGSRLSVELNFRASEKSPHLEASFLYKLSSLLIDMGFLYNFLYLALSAIALAVWPVYPILLLDFVKRINTLARVLHAVWRKIAVILMLSLTCLIVVYGFSIIAFLDLQQYFENELVSHGGLAYCDNLWTCSLSTLLLGVRAEGGIGQVTSQALSGDSLYLNKLIFNLFFYLLISVLFFCLLFGIVIDSLAKSREQQATRIVNSRRCFICGSSMEVLEANRINWQNHVYSEHNVHSYMFFLVYIRNKPFHKCRGVERFVKQQLSIGGIDFFPLPAQVVNDDN